MEFDNSKMPPSATIRSAINQLETTDLSKVSFERILEMIHRDMKQAIPLTTITVKKGNFIQRARINGIQDLYSSESEISYRTDIANIVKYGRANMPYQTVFYGALPSDKIEEPTMTLLYELDEQLRIGIDTGLIGGYYLTVGQWEIMENLQLVCLVMNNAVSDSQPEINWIKDAFINDINQIYPERAEDIHFVAKFFSDQFAKTQINTHEDYKISAAFAKIAMSDPKREGILYPSVRAGYEAMNIALPPNVVESKLRLNAVGVYHVEKKGSDVTFLPYAGTKDFGPCNSKFNWILYSPSPQS